MTKVDIEKLLAQQAKTYAAVADHNKITAIGQHVVTLLARDGELSAAALLASLQAAIDGSPSAHGQGRADVDLMRLQAEAALHHLRSLRPADPE